MPPRDCPARLLMLARGKRAARDAVDEYLDARRVMCARHPHMIGSPLVPEGWGHGSMNREVALIGEGQPPLRQRDRPFLAALRHGDAIVDRQFTASVRFVGPGGDPPRLG